MQLFLACVNHGFIMKDAWINTNGELIEVGDMQHNNYASELLEKELGFEGMMKLLDDNNDCYPYEILHDRGWIRVQTNTYGNGTNNVEILGNCIDLTKIMRNTIDPPMNSKQMQVAKRICKDNNVDFSNAINDRRFH